MHISVKQRIIQLESLVDGARELGLHVARDRAMVIIKRERRAAAGIVLQ
jgi:hypothetical protein